MNGLLTTFEKWERVYHIIGIGTLIKTIKVPTTIRLKNNSKEITYLDKQTIDYNINQLYNSKNNNNIKLIT